MSYYNSAALRGGWDTSLTNYRDLPNGTLIRDSVVDSLSTRYDVDPGVIENFVNVIFNYDNLLATAHPGRAAALKKQFIGDSVAKQKLFNMIRRKIHIGDTGGQRLRLTRAERLERRQAAAQARDANLAYLRNPMNSWWGSSGYVPGTTRTAGRYSGLSAYKLDPAQRAARRNYMRNLYGEWLPSKPIAARAPTEIYNDVGVAGLLPADMRAPPLVAAPPAAPALPARIGMQGTVIGPPPGAAAGQRRAIQDTIDQLRDAARIADYMEGPENN